MFQVFFPFCLERWGCMLCIFFFATFFSSEKKKKLEMENCNKSDGEHIKRW